MMIGWIVDFPFVLIFSENEEQYTVDLHCLLFNLGFSSIEGGIVYTDDLNMRWYLCVDICGCGTNDHVCILCVCVELMGW